MSHNWVKVFAGKDPQKVEILLGILNDYGIQGVRLNQQDSAYPVVGEICVMVNGMDAIRARHIIEKFENK